MIAVAWGKPQPEKKAQEPRPLIAIANEVASKYGITVQQMFSRRHLKVLTVARQEAYWRAYNETPASLPQIGRVYGNRDHTTILWGIRRHEERMGAGTHGAA